MRKHSRPSRSRGLRSSFSFSSLDTCVRAIVHKIPCIYYTYPRSRLVWSYNSISRVWYEQGRMQVLKDPTLVNQRKDVMTCLKAFLAAMFHHNCLSFYGWTPSYTGRQSFSRASDSLCEREPIGKPHGKKTLRNYHMKRHMEESGWLR